MVIKIKFGTSLFVISLLVTILFNVDFSVARRQGFTVDLIHRDSPRLPFYNSSLNQYERLRNSIKRSISKIDRFEISSSSGDVQSRVNYAHGEYFMELSIGTPPVTQLGIIDTGSDLIWTQCQPCSQCYKQVLPIFDPSKSSTYMAQSCDTQPCLALGGSQHTCTRENTCYYSYQYGDSSYTAGHFATETITFNSQDGTSLKSFPNISFGCGNNNDGKFTTDGSGIVGLGGGPLSLISQLHSSINGKFSYCLIPLSKEGNFTSKINFGDNSIVSGADVISTPIVKGDPDTFYYLTLNEISIGQTKIPFYEKSSTNNNKGNIIIDVGATMTILPLDMYNALISTLDKVIQAKKVNDPTGQLEVCYQTSNSGRDLGIPNVTLHFEGGDLVLKSSNTFVEVANGVICLAILAPQDQLGASLGNIAQMDFLIGYDVVEGKVSFKPTDCTTAA